ncbi:DNA-directed RNA polymerase subunit alpha [Rhynchospora pubera]|uniref:DNA-directed RNA polymerase subunit alpha n=1 Tax=Rhynchospora pubera TaxID=906938 RepID=A0AAV8D544_9POAL|nr:DNA-directed RNA polymerase subunit alpha [Rhynchospora pubera]
MSYVPPHKRHDHNLTPTPFPSFLNPKPFTPSRYHHRCNSKVVYAPHSISRWYATSSDSEALALVPYDSAFLEKMYGSKPLTLAVNKQANLVEEEERAVLKGTVEKVAKSLIKTGQHAMKERDESEDVKLLVVARIGKVLVAGDSSVCIDSIKNASMNEEGLNQPFKKRFYTNVSEEYIRDVEKLLVEKFGFKFEVEKERYCVKIIDKRQPDSTIQCKCTASHDGGLDLYKIERNQLRYMVTDISCVSKNFDLRIMLSTIKKLKNFDADVMNAIDQIISEAVTDSDIKGGLRWPLGKESVADRFVIVDTWQTKIKVLSTDKIRVKMRVADRFHFSTSTGESANEVSFRFSGLSEQLTDEGSIVDVIQGALDFIWENFLSQGSIGL